MKKNSFHHDSTATNKSNNEVHSLQTDIFLFSRFVMNSFTIFFLTDKAKMPWQAPDKKAGPICTILIVNNLNANRKLVNV